MASDLYYNNDNDNDNCDNDNCDNDNDNCDNDNDNDNGNYNSDDDKKRSECVPMYFMYSSACWGQVIANADDNAEYSSVSFK